MSTTIQAYVPRTTSLPSSAVSSPNHLPHRQAYVPRSSSVTPSANEEARRQAEAILKLLSSLPAPLSDKLGTTFLPAPRPQTPSPPSSSPYPSFKAYARAQKRKPSDDDQPAYGLGLSGTGSVGGNGLPSRPPLKKARTASGADVREPTGGHELQRTASTSSGLTPPLRASTHLPSPHRPARSSLRNEIKRGTSDWTKEQWSNLYMTLGRRAHNLKRTGDAYMHPATAKGHLRGRVSEDVLRGVLLLTDSLCLYLYRNFADERVYDGHVRSAAFRELDGLIQFVLGRWGSLRSNPKTPEEHKAMIKGMLGFIYLIEAVTQYHVAMSDLRSLHRRAKELPSVPSSSASNNLPAGSSVSGHGPSPASSSASPGAASRSPASSAPSEIPADMLRQISASAHATTSASQALLSSRHYLSTRTLRETFPVTWNLAITSDLADEILPTGHDSLGCARSLDIDDPDVFAWPIELGMQNAIAHVAVFGRALVREFAGAAGKPWEAVLTDVESPEGNK